MKKLTFKNILLLVLFTLTACGFQVLDTSKTNNFSIKKINNIKTISINGVIFISAALPLSRLECLFLIIYTIYHISHPALVYLQHFQLLATSETLIQY